MVDLTNGSFLERYLKQARAAGTVLCVGLDPTREHIPPDYGDPDDQGCWLQYLMDVVDCASDIGVAVFKPQHAYYLEHGAEGLTLLSDLIEWIHHRGKLVILDAKFGDIGPTMKAYGEFAFDYMFADACTVNGYLGDTYLPDKKCEGWLEWLWRGRMPIRMVRTSNPEATVFQELLLKPNQPSRPEVELFKSNVPDMNYEWQALETKRLDELVRDMTDGNGAVGCVIGATNPEQAVRCRGLMGNEVFALVPGYGAQGGGADDAMAAAPTNGGLEFAVNSSRGVTTAWRDKDGSPKPGDAIDHVRDAIVAAKRELREAHVRKLGYDPYAQAA